MISNIGTPKVKAHIHKIMIISISRPALFFTFINKLQPVPKFM